MSLSVPSTPQKYQEPIIGEEHCGVKLRDSAEEERRRREQFPLPMLIRASANPPFVRLVLPSCCSINDHCSYLLITQKRLIIYNGNEAAIVCRSKIAQMAYEIVASKELPTSAIRVEIANDDQKTECHFWRLLKRDEADTKIEKENLLSECCGGVETSEEDQIFEVMANGTTKILSEGKAPEIAMFDRAKVLVFYFISEIYVWVGSEANKSLIENAMNFARSLGLPNVRAKRIVCQNDHSSTMEWTILRRISEGIVDTLFKYKFSNWPNNSKRRKSLSQRPKSVSSVPCEAKSIAKISSEKSLIRETAAKMSEQSPNGSGELRLEDNILRPDEKNVFTEALRIYESVGEQLKEKGQRRKGLVEFEADKCYVIEWEYRIERTGIRKLDGSAAAQRECGRRRKCFFYWLGPRSTPAEQSRCALALREKDTELCEHIRVEAGKEAPMLLHILDGLIVWGTGSNVLCVIGSSGNCYLAQEMRFPVKFRSQGIYLRICDGSIECLRGEQCPDALLESSKALAKKIAEAEGLKWTGEVAHLGEDIAKPREWTKAPKMFRFRDNEFWEMNTAHPQANFTFTQKELRDCVVVDQGKHLWLWADNEQPIATFVLKVAFLYWYGEEFAFEKSVGKASDATAHLINGGTEPDEFKALFAEWEEEGNEVREGEQKKHSAEEKLTEVIAERTKHRSADELRRRELPAGCDTKHLEQYLSEAEFVRVFGISREQFDTLPRWRQLSMKKEAGLF
ncbi:hypothetical protein niasHS_010737 [Heterodera schachtii]|uniref:HP domain-containing protein n=1 Tax=Heterodera schachtii TaxID=97005 RepID=A0ABD2J025_HETSC